MSPNDATMTPLGKGEFILVTFMLCAANFMAVLNTTIANVAVPTIAGNLGVTLSQGTWVITSYAVGEAITVPLTGWLAARFGSVRVFAIAMVCFGLLSAACGMAPSLGLLVTARLLQGIAGGPLMPLSQTLLLRIFPKEKAGAAIGMWSMTTLVAPVVGPIAGGYLCDEYTWHDVFFLNAPIGLVCGFFAWKLLKRYADELRKNPIDVIGLALLIIWVMALQIMLDEGKDLDWFASNEIIMLCIVAVVAFCAFLIWEWYDEHPIVDLKVFRHRGFWVSVLTISLAYAAFFGINVLTPLWLQNFMAYTATNAGLTTCWMGLSALLISPFVSKSAEKMDSRKIVFFGILLMGFVAFWRSIATTDMDYWSIALPILVMGFGIPCFFIPVTGLALKSVELKEIYSAAGLMSFLRTLSGAVSTSVVTTTWTNTITVKHAELSDVVQDQGLRTLLGQQNIFSQAATNEFINSLVTSQAVMLATNDLMLFIGFTFTIAACIIWLAPKPKKPVSA
ncbi:multidrug resistance transporter EmrB [Sulfurospirillum diekertiae]|uniref:Multidrug resistance transporter EmrB n=1 Tax=Sulfurospirillum diekertiae TaxID=1854492 RepID=A0A290HET5_9BACT|nr:DHA2 family efflux MFS transporter permease subunit [Sulfurospirillum diekertiae]ATB69925.1 multidrug resistance transporter EmrB [Sulfurospirillum diekertiae]